MDLQPILDNELVRIRPLKNSDMESLYNVAKDPEIWEQHPCKRYLRSEFEQFFIESIRSKGALIIFDKKTDKIIGSSRFKKVEGFSDSVEIGWTFLDRKYWGGKYNKTVKDLMIAHAFNYIGNILFYVDKDNIRSQRAVEKIGGKKVDASEYEKLPETNSNNLTFVIRKPNKE